MIPTAQNSPQIVLLRLPRNPPKKILRRKYPNSTAIMTSQLRAAAERLAKTAKRSIASTGKLSETKKIQPHPLRDCSDSGLPMESLNASINPSTPPDRAYTQHWSAPLTSRAHRAVNSSRRSSTRQNALVVLRGPSIEALSRA